MNLMENHVLSININVNKYIMRDNSVSIAKAFAIVLMVLAHTWFWDIGEKWINMFHMPLFFFMAGYCFKEKYLTDFKAFAIKRWVGLYKPYVKWSLIFLALHNVFFFLNFYNDEYGTKGNVSQLYALTDFVKRAIKIVISMSGNDQLLGGYWFLKSLFVGSFISYFSIRYVKNSALRGGVFTFGNNNNFWIESFNTNFPCIGKRVFGRNDIYNGLYL